MKNSKFKIQNSKLRFFCLLFLAVACFLITVTARADTTEVQGISFVTGETQDVLTVRLPVAVQPQINRLYQPDRIVVELPGLTVAPSLPALTANRSSVTIEKFEIHTLMESAENTGVKAGVRYDTSIPTVFITAYVKPDVEAKVYPEQTNEQILIHIIYYRTQFSPRPEPLFPQPENTLKNIGFTREGVEERIELSFAYPLNPYVYETTDPHRLFLILPHTDIPPETMRDLREVMQQPSLFRLELYNIGALPVPYPQMNYDREYHFVGFPSPFANDKFLQNLIGFQKRDAVVAFYPNNGTYYTIYRPEDKDNRKIILTFEKSPIQSTIPSVCQPLSEERSPYISYTPPLSQPYSLEDEEGRLHQYSP